VPIVQRKYHVIFGIAEWRQWGVSLLKLYYYTSALFALDAIERRRVKMSTIEALNDPFELLGMSLKNKDERLQFRNQKSRISLSYGMVCLSQSAEDPVMWGHYAEKHSGVVLEFEVNPETVTKVSYERKRLIDVERNFISKTPITYDTVKELLSVKYENWSYENEYRIVEKLPAVDPKTKLFFKSFSKDFLLTGVLLGPTTKTTSADVMHYLQGLLNKVEIRSTRLAFTKFSVTENLRSPRIIFKPDFSRKSAPNSPT
jgi:hypothetical protein